MTDEELEEMRVQTHQNSEMMIALVRTLSAEFDGLREDIREVLYERMRYFAATGSDGMAAANRDLAASPLFTGL